MPTLISSAVARLQAFSITASFAASLATVLTTVLTLAACTRPLGDASLRPPGKPMKVRDELVIRDLSVFEFQTGYPKRFLEQRVAFNAACDASTYSPDEGAAADAKLLQKLCSASGSPEQFASSLQGNFELVQVSVEGAAVPANAGIMTGYATPEVTVRLKPDERYRFPIFGDLREKHPELVKLSRRELLASAQAREAAIAWIDDPLAWALVETNGSARLVIEESTAKDGRKSKSAITRVATNGRPWTSIGRWLAYRGLIDGATYTFADVAQAAAAHPDKTEEAALDNERVVYFAFAAERNFPPTYGLPVGKLMSGYSCAADQSIYPAGSVLVIVERSAQTPAEGAPPRTARFVFVQDAGGAIEGPGRIDAYFGDGIDALIRAGQTRTPIDVYRMRSRN